MALRKHLLLVTILCGSMMVTAQQIRKPASPKKTAQQQKAVRPVKKVRHQRYGTGVVEAPAPPPPIIRYVEQAPEFPGGRAALDRYLAEHIRYPAIAREEGIEGTVAVRFIVDGDGAITKGEIMSDIGGGCGREVLRVVIGMPRWQPYKLNGRHIPCVFNLKTRFSMDR